MVGSPEHASARKVETGSFAVHCEFTPGKLSLSKRMCNFEKQNQSFDVTSHGESVLFLQANLSERRRGREAITADGKNIFLS